MAKEKKQECPAPGAPAWMATYGDLVTLLMCFFVLLFAFSTIDNKKFTQFMNSFQGGAGPFNAGTSLVEDEYIFDGMPETVESNSPGEQIYRAVFIKVDVEVGEDGEVLKGVATNGISKNPNDYEWQSSNPEVASVNSEGEITVKKNEPVIIFAKDKETGVVGVYHLNSELQNADVPEFQNASDWAKSELERALELGLIPEVLRNMDMQAEINRREFAAVSVKIYEALTDISVSGEGVENPFSDTEDLDVMKAYSVGITNGISPTKFAPNMPLNREQAATMLTRVFKKAEIDGWSLEKDDEFPLDYSGVTPFADDRDISPWAKSSVYFMVKNDIIRGVGNNMFAPKSLMAEESAMMYADSTREQAIVMGLRMVENLKGN